MNRFSNALWIGFFVKYNEILSMTYENTSSETPIRSSRNVIDHLIDTSIFDSIVDANEIVDFSEYAAVFCDDELPYFLYNKIKSFGPEIFDNIIYRLISYDWESVDDFDQEYFDQRISAEFINVLKYNSIDFHGQIIKKYYSTEKPHELISDAVRTYLISLGSIAVPAMIDYINQSFAVYNDLNESCEYLLLSITGIGREHRDNRIYDCLRNSFRKMKNKALGAICIGDYGDGRGIATLKGWLDNHTEVNDLVLIGEIISSIKRLGGDVSDVQKRLDFTKGF